jgi:hypothetical protein
MFMARLARPTEELFPALRSKLSIKLPPFEAPELQQDDLRLATDFASEVLSTYDIDLIIDKYHEAKMGRSFRRFVRSALATVGTAQRTVDLLIQHFDRARTNLIYNRAYTGGVVGILSAGAHDFVANLPRVKELLKPNEPSRRAWLKMFVTSIGFVGGIALPPSVGQAARDLVTGQDARWVVMVAGAPRRRM